MHSGCDYYMQNRQLNAIAMKKHRLDLSKYWQCTPPHTYDQLASSYMNTPYQPIKPTKYNSYLVSDQGISNYNSTTKRVQLFSPPSSENSVSKAPNPSILDHHFIHITMEISFADYSNCLVERDSVCAEQDSAFAKMDIISAESARECEAAHEEADSIWL
jgi:hypothetical protein